MFIRSGIQRAHAQRRASGEARVAGLRHASITTELPTCSSVGGTSWRRSGLRPGLARLALAARARSRGRARSRRARAGARLAAACAPRGLRATAITLRSRSITTVAASSLTRVARLRYRQPVDARALGGGPGSVPRRSRTARAPMTIAQASRPPGRRCARARRRNAIRPAAAAEQLDRLHRHQARARSRAGPARSGARRRRRSRRPARRPARASAASRRASRSSAVTRVTRARELQRDAPAAGADVEDRADRLPRCASSRHSGRSAR